MSKANPEDEISRRREREPHMMNEAELATQVPVRWDNYDKARGPRESRPTAPLLDGSISMGACL